MTPPTAPRGTPARQDPGRIPQLEEQIAVLNAALTAEKMSHAGTKQKLLLALSLCHFDAALEVAKGES